MQAELCLSSHALLGEGSIWDDQRQLLYWIDILNREVHSFDPLTSESRTWSVGKLVGTVVPSLGSRLLLGLQNGVGWLDPETGHTEDWQPLPGMTPDIRCNDGKCDPRGRFWIGTMPLNGRDPVARLYSVNPDGSATTRLTGVTISNGLVWTKDQKCFYYIDSPTYQVVAYDYEAATGEISNPRVAIQVEKSLGAPDGMTIDAGGKLWIAHWGGWAVRQWDPETGKLLGEIKVPAAQVTSCALGGKNLDKLYITTARTGLSNDALSSQPEAGSLFCARVSTPGVPAFRFAAE